MSEQHNSHSVDTLPGEERGIPHVNDSGPSTAQRGLIVIVILLILGAAAGIAYWKFQKNKERQETAAEQKTLQLTSAVPARTFTEPPAPPAPPASRVPPTSPLQATAVPVVPAAIQAAPPLPGNAGAPQGKPPQILDKAASSIMMAGSGKEKGPDITNAAAQKPIGEAGPADGGMSALLSSTRTPARSAGILGERNFLLAKGGFIDCALKTRLDSTVPGMTSCVVTRNIYSDNGKVLLLEGGSEATGEYRANMKQGMARIYVLWNRIKTPNGVVINLDSLGTDALGGAGVPGYIETHFWERFGGAVMLSLVDDIASGVTTRSGGNNGQFNFNGTGDATQDMAAEALKNTINIPPTLYKNQGEQIGIFVARDLDFSSVYDVAAQ